MNMSLNILLLSIFSFQFMPKSMAETRTRCPKIANVRCGGNSVAKYENNILIYEKVRIHEQSVNKLSGKIKYEIDYHSKPPQIKFDTPTTRINGKKVTSLDITENTDSIYISATEDGILKIYAIDKPDKNDKVTFDVATVDTNANPQLMTLENNLIFDPMASAEMECSHESNKAVCKSAYCQSPKARCIESKLKSMQISNEAAPGSPPQGGTPASTQGKQLR